MLTIPIAFIVGGAVVGVVEFFFLKNNRKFLDVSLAKLVTKEAAKLVAQQNAAKVKASKP